jgi:hypothetical protein
MEIVEGLQLWGVVSKYGFVTIYPDEETARDGQRRKDKLISFTCTNVVTHA